MRYVVTGGCGFIGSHLVDALIARGDAVVALDDLSTGLTGNLAPGAELIEGCITDPETVARAVHGTHGVFHLAAVASVARSNEAWLETHRVNQSGTVTVMAAAAAARRLPVVYASSATVYGANEDLPLDEAAPARAAHRLWCGQARQRAARPGGGANPRIVERRPALRQRLRPAPAAGIAL